MMLLSRFWYAVLGLFCAASLYVAYLAVGQYNRRNNLAAGELIASDSQTVGWALQIDGRRRLDALLVGAVDKGVQDALLASNGKDSVPPNARGGARKALASVLEKIPAEYRGDERRAPRLPPRRHLGLGRPHLSRGRAPGRVRRHPGAGRRHRRASPRRH